jgi:hypothetical protein
MQTHSIKTHVHLHVSNSQKVGPEFTLLASILALPCYTSDLVQSVRMLVYQARSCAVLSKGEQL